MHRKYSQDKHIKSTRSLQKHPEIIKSIKKCKLSSCIDSNMQHTEKLSLVRQAITTIDVIPMAYYNNVRVLYLSDNHIQSLENIQFFNKLQTLSLSNNNLSKLSTIRYLLPLKQLINLSLDGNPITKFLFYVPYALGLIDTLKTLDHYLIDDNKKENQLQNFSMYEQGMSQLLKNYMTMLHIFRIYHKVSIHRIIQQTRKRLDNTQQDIQDFDIEKYLRATSNYMQEFPSNILIDIQGQLCRDLQNMTRIQLQELQNPNPMQIYFRSICQLQKKQMQKISQLKSKFYIKMSSILQQSEKMHHIQLENTFELMFKVYNKQQKTMEQFYFENKIYKKYFSIMKKKLINKKSKLIVVKCFNEILDGNILRIYKECMQKISQCAETKTVHIFCDKIQKIIRKKKLQSFRALKLYKRNAQKLKNILVKRQIQYQLRRYFQKWRNYNHLLALSQSNQQQAQTIAVMIEKQKRYIKKIQLLEQLLKISQNQYKDSLVASPYPKLLALINHGDKSQTSKSNLSLLHSNFSESSSKLKTQQLQSSRVELFPSVKKIKKFNYFNSQHKQNRVHTENIQQKVFQQRKLNFSRNNRDNYQ